MGGSWCRWSGCNILTDSIISWLDIGGVYGAKNFRGGSRDAEGLRLVLIPNLLSFVMLRYS